jgi:hypothetical protein
VLLLTVYLIFAMTLYLLPPRLHNERNALQNPIEDSARRICVVGRLGSPDAVTTQAGSA